MNKHYIELPAKNLQQTKDFFSAVFNWSFIDYGPEYTAFSDPSLNGGFFQSELSSNTASGAALLVFYSVNIKATLQKIEKNGGVINRPIFKFPGGYRFHFIEPSGNEFAVWSEACA
ncbi:glyoxalase [Psychromonas sp. MB-3u-54]|uniref:VOC family protein n=1 Tax=Psychromonas sp. MB-3u-54 TaxID=2058319 RepID=UPI000C31BB2B|nr:VOC family protein [Psychromonas sp. MB-3u-54]PKH04434.1 glyoxalase [Psychromonas sp. MB-3u-54]